MTPREQLLAKVLAERFPKPETVEHEQRRQPTDTPWEIAARRRVLCEALGDYGLRGRLPVREAA